MIASAEKIPKLKVVQSNSLIEAGYRLTLDEKRLIIAAISTIDSRLKAPDSIDITAHQYATLFKIDMDSAYKQLKAATVKLYNRNIRIKNADKQDDFRWIYKKTYHKREGRVTLYLTPDIKPYISELRRSYSGYYLDSISDLKSFYSIRIFELINQYKDYGERWITIEDFRKTMQVENKYALFSDLRKYVLDPSVKEVDKKSIYNLSYQLEKEGRKIVKIWFKFSRKDQGRIIAP